MKERTSREVGLRSETREIVFCAFFTASDCGFPGRGMKHWLGLYNDQLDHGLVWGGLVRISWASVLSTPRAVGVWPRLRISFSLYLHAQRDLITTFPNPTSKLQPRLPRSSSRFFQIRKPGGSSAKNHVMTGLAEPAGAYDRYCKKRKEKQKYVVELGAGSWNCLACDI